MCDLRLENTFEAVEWLTSKQIKFGSETWNESKVRKLWQVVSERYPQLPFDIDNVNHTVVADSLNQLSNSK